MLRKLTLLLSIVLTASAVELNIYRSVTELRSAMNGIGCLTYKFINGEYYNIIDGSVSWEGTPFVRQEIYNTAESLKGATVRVRQPTACDCQIVEAKIIDPNSMLLENSETGTKFYADSRAVEYVSAQPENGGNTLHFIFKDKNTKYQGTLSYLMRDVTWAPTYDLSLTNDDTCSVTAYANIRNNQLQEYEVTNTNLYSGDIQLAVNSYSPKYSPMRPPSLKGPAADSADGRQIESAGEQRGFYFYSLKNTYKLRPSSSIRLPFVEVRPKCRFQYKATTGISVGEYKGVFQRNYDFTPDKFVPAGVVTVRDRNVLVGQARIPDAPQNFTQTMIIGEDNDVRYEIKGTQVASSQDDEQPAWRTYQVRVTISNFKDKAVRGQLDFYGATQTEISQSTCKSAKLNTNMINLPFSLNKNNNLNCDLTVKLTWG